MTLPLLYRKSEWIDLYPSRRWGGSEGESTSRQTCFVLVNKTSYVFSGSEVALVEDCYLLKSFARGLGAALISPGNFYLEANDALDD
jgi:hypothetical protein